MRFAGALALLIVTVSTGGVAQDAPPSTLDPLHRPFDQLLDIYVRDGFVYYNALQDRARRARSLRGVARRCRRRRRKPKGTPDQQRAFWINAYNALVLRTIVDNFPIRGKSPRVSARQHPADPRRLRAAHAPRGGTHGHARRYREGHPRAARRRPRVPRARTWRRRRRPAQERGVRCDEARRAAREGRGGIAVAQGDRPRRSGGQRAGGVAALLLARGRVHRDAWRTRRTRSSRSAARSSAPCSP